MEAKEYYSWLLNRYYQGQASTEEVEELFTALGKDMDQQEWVAMIETLHRQAGPDLQYDPVRWQQMADRITGRQEERKPGSMNSRWWMAAAAAVVLAIVGIITLNRNEDRQEVAGIPNADSIVIVPGSNKAKLTLADGRVIDLDAAANGELADDHGAVVTKKNNGSLVYSKDGKATAAGTHTLATPRGGQYQLSLPDGTKVWLNAASSITYPATFPDGPRKIKVTGEAYFEVAHDPKRPFRVNVNDRSEVEVLGTSFNINAYADEPATKTTLVEGSVKIVAGNGSAVLSPGEQASLQEGKLSVNDGADVAAVLAWKNGQFPMKNVDLATFMRQVSRWYDVDVILKGSTNKIIFGGFMSRDVKLSTLLKALEVYGIKTRIENKTLIVQ